MVGYNLAGMINASEFFLPAAERLQLCRRSLGLDRPGSNPGDGHRYGPCPLAGKRAVELAKGVFQEEFAETAKSYLVTVMECCSGLSGEDLLLVVDDFEHGHAHMWEVVTLKMQQWRVLPWKLVALADWDGARLQATAKEILTEFSQCDDQAKHHRIT